MKQNKESVQELKELQKQGKFAHHVIIAISVILALVMNYLVISNIHPEPRIPLGFKYLVYFFSGASGICLVLGTIFSKLKGAY